MKITLPALVAAVLAVLQSFVPVQFRWAVALLADLFANYTSKLDAPTAATPVDATPDSIRDIVAGLFDAILAKLTYRPFLKSVVTSLKAFVLSNLLDAIWDKLAHNGARLSAGAAPMHYSPADCTKLGADLEAAACDHAAHVVQVTAPAPAG